jgi:zinc finger HIT domain-containing protein 1
MNFGVIECAPTGKSISAPGWAYVPDTGPNVTALQPGRKRARTQITASSHETTAKQDAKILREIEELQRENVRDVFIPIPAKTKDNARGALKTTNSSSI